jgi:hypothetical protein
VTVIASYLQCTKSRPANAIKACLPTGRTPPLRPGQYQAKLFQLGHLVPAPPAVPVRVTG